MVDHRWRQQRRTGYQRRDASGEKVLGGVDHDGARAGDRLSDVPVAIDVRLAVHVAEVENRWGHVRHDIVIVHVSERPGRVAGVTKFNLRKMLRFGADGIISSSSFPLRLFYIVGLLCSLPFLTYLIYSFCLHIWRDSELVPGWTSLLLSIISFGTLNLVCLGIMGEYMGSVFDEVKRRPLYVVDEIVQGRSE